MNGIDDEVMLGFGVNGGLAEALSGSEKSKWFSWWRVCLYILVLVAGVVALFAVQRSLKLWAVVNDTGASYAVDVSAAMDSAADDKVKLMDYVVSKIDVDDAWVTDEIMSEVRRVDPANSFYLYAAAAEYFKSSGMSYCVKEVTNRAGGFDEMRDVREWEVVDDEKYEQAMVYVREAGKLDGINWHLGGDIDAMLERFRTMKVNKELDNTGQFLAIGTLVGMVPYKMIHLLSLGELFSAKFYALSVEGSVEEVRLWVSEYVTFIGMMLNSDVSLLNELVSEALLKSALGNMLAASERVGLVDQSKLIEKLIDEYAKEQLARSSGLRLKTGSVAYGDKGLHSRDSFIMEYFCPDILSRLGDKKIDLPDVNAGRFADHAFAGRVLSIVGFMVVLVLLLLCLSILFIYSGEMRHLAMHGLGALRMADGLLIIGLGVFLPVVFYVIINEYTSLGVREWSVLVAKFSLVTIQFAGMLVCVCMLSVLLLQWRLCVRLPKLVTKVSVLAWVLTGMAFLSVVVIGFYDVDSQILPYGLAVTLLILAGLLGVCMLGVYLFSKKYVFTRVILFSGILPVYGFVMVVFAGMSLMYHAQEKYWVSESGEITFEAEQGGLLAVEYRVAQALKADSRGRLELIRDAFD